MQFTERDRKLMLVIPAILLFAGYGWFFFWPKLSALNAARREHTALRAKAVPQSAMDMDRARVALLQRDVQRATQELESLRSRWRSEAGCFTDPTHRTGRCADLVNLLHKYGLQLLEDDHAKGRNDMVGPSSLDALLQQSDKPPAPAAPGKQASARAKLPPLQRRRLHFTGNYAAVSLVMEAIGRGEPSVIPAALTMNVREENTPEWILVVWI